MDRSTGIKSVDAGLAAILHAHRRSLEEAMTSWPSRKVDAAQLLADSKTSIWSEADRGQLEAGLCRFRSVFGVDFRLDQNKDSITQWKALCARVAAAGGIHPPPMEDSLWRHSCAAWLDCELLSLAFALSLPARRAALRRLICAREAEAESGGISLGQSGQGEGPHWDATEYTLALTMFDLYLRKGKESEVMTVWRDQLRGTKFGRGWSAEKKTPDILAPNQSVVVVEEASRLSLGSCVENASRGHINRLRDCWTCVLSGLSPQSSDQRRDVSGYAVSHRWGIVEVVFACRRRKEQGQG